MTNHYHMVVETQEANLSRGMAWFNGNFTRKFNHTYNRVGHIFQGRFHSVLVEKQNYLLELARYVVLNPVRAEIVKHPCDWNWSSYHSMIGRSPAPPWLNTDWTLGLFSSDRSEAIKRYEKFVLAGIREPSVWEARTGDFLGGEQWIHSVLTKDLVVN